MSNQHVGNHQCAGVDERVPRNALLALKLHQRIKRIARRLTPYARPQRITLALKGERQREKLGDRLDRKALRLIAHREHRAINVHHCYAKLIARNVRQFGNVGSDLAFADDRLQRGVDAFEGVLVVQAAISFDQTRNLLIETPQQEE